MIHYALFLLAKLVAAWADENPHLFNANAFLVGLPLSSFIGPFMHPKRAAHDILRPLLPLYKGGFK